MTNGEKFMTWKERSKAFEDFCKRHKCDLIASVIKPECPMNRSLCLNSGNCKFGWLELEYEELGPKPEPCPFCGRKPVISNPNENCNGTFVAMCDCGVHLIGAASRNSLVEKWNRRAQ